MGLKIIIKLSKTSRDDDTYSLNSDKVSVFSERVFLRTVSVIYGLFN